jgi:hypothetical protein
MGSTGISSGESCLPPVRHDLSPFARAGIDMPARRLRKKSSGLPGGDDPGICQRLTIPQNVLRGRFRGGGKGGKTGRLATQGAGGPGAAGLGWRRGSRNGWHYAAPLDAHSKCEWTQPEVFRYHKNLQMNMPRTSALPPTSVCASIFVGRFRPPSGSKEQSVSLTRRGPLDFTILASFAN